MKSFFRLALCTWLTLGPTLDACAAQGNETRESLQVLVVFGPRATEPSRPTPRFVAGSPGLEIVTAPQAISGGAASNHTARLTVSWPKPTQPPRKPHSIWQHLLDHGEPGQVARLKDDPGLRPDAPVLTVLTAQDGTRGFSIGLEQLARHAAMWLPEHDVFITRADEPVDSRRTALRSKATACSTA